MKVSELRLKDEPVKADSSFTQLIKEKKTDAFSADHTAISKSETVSAKPFIKINPGASFKEITYVSNRSGTNRPDYSNEENCSSITNCKSIFKPLPIEDRGLDNESDEYAFSAYPKSDKKFQLGIIKSKLESYTDMTGVEHGTFRVQYGNTTGDKKFNFDGASIGLELEARQNTYQVNQQPEILLPVDNNSNYFFEQRNLSVDHNHGNLTGVVSLEGVKLGIKYEKNQSISISNVEFHEGALTTNLVDFSKKYPYIAVPLATVLAGGIVTGGYFLSKSTGPINLNLGNVVVYRNDSEKNKIRVGISPSLTVTGSEKFLQAFKIPGGAASILYKYDDNLTLNLNGGYNSLDGFHTFAGVAMKF